MTAGDVWAYCWQAERRDRLAAEAKLARIRAVLDDARRVSPSPTMSVYVDDIGAALDGREVGSIRKRGQRG